MQKTGKSRQQQIQVIKSNWIESNDGTNILVRITYSFPKLKGSIRCLVIRDNNHLDPHLKSTTVIRKITNSQRKEEDTMSVTPWMLA
jgi:hypothetical protein